MARAVLEPFVYSHAAFGMASDDLERDQLLHRTRGGEGPSILWHLGHITHYRIIVLNRLGVERTSPYGEMFGGDADDGSTYPSLDVLREQWNGWHAEIEKAFEGVTEAQLLGKYPLPDGSESSRTLLGALSFFGWHEAMHLGSVTALRVEIGKPSIAERRFAAQKSR
jgi:uncharacterized damage-inducible protein DinB